MRLGEEEHVELRVAGKAATGNDSELAISDVGRGRLGDNPGQNPKVGARQDNTFRTISTPTHTEPEAVGEIARRLDGISLRIPYPPPATPTRRRCQRLPAIPRAATVIAKNDVSIVAHRIWREKSPSRDEA